MCVPLMGMSLLAKCLFVKIMFLYQSKRLSPAILLCLILRKKTQHLI